jgi:hypothetical protein
MFPLMDLVVWLGFPFPCEFHHRICYLEKAVELLKISFLERVLSRDDSKEMTQCCSQALKGLKCLLVAGGKRPNPNGFSVVRLSVRPPGSNILKSEKHITCFPSANRNDRIRQIKRKVLSQKHKRSYLLRMILALSVSHTLFSLHMYTFPNALSRTIMSS